MSKFYVRGTAYKMFISVFGLLMSTMNPALAGGVDITSFGHSSLLIKGGGSSVLLNPFRAVGCAAGLQEPKISADVILASSTLADEGARVAQGLFLVKPGSYQVKRMNFEGFLLDHDRFEGRRFGKATAWIWKQGGLTFAHLGGAAGELTTENKILIGRPDVLIIGVGGGAKVYDGIEAAKIVRDLNPKRVIPVQYLQKSQPNNCDQNGIELFLESMKDVDVKKVGKLFAVPKSIKNDLTINIIE